MSYKSKNQLLSHDAAGYETDFIDFSELDDGYGNRVAHGDLSVLRAVEEGCRDTRASDHDADTASPTALDKHPWQNPAHRRAVYAAEGRGDVPAGTARRYGKHK